MIGTILLFLLVLSVLVIAHEWGHYFAARKSGMDVDEFGIGFPPRLFAIKAKNGMLWTLNLIPLGGFVRIKGENGEERGTEGAFSSKGFWPRLITLSAGVIMNLFVAWILFTAGFLFGLPAVVEGLDDTRAIVTDKRVQIVEVVADSPAAKAGIEVGDIVKSIGGETFSSGEAARTALVPNEDGSPEEIVVDRAGEEKTISVAPAYLEDLGRAGVGVAITETGSVRYPFYIAPIMGAETTLSMVSAIISAFIGIFVGLFHNENVVSQLSGPVGIAVLTGQVAKLGISHLIQFAAMLSVNLAVLNALPFPALDGGRIFFLFAETIRRKPNSQKFEQAVHGAGFAILIILVIFVTYRDIMKLF
jgi:regulator of sigma E protease